MGMKQRLIVLNFRCLQENEGRLRTLKVEDMEASRPEDVEEILASIPDKTAFNNSLQELLFTKLLPQWSNLDACDQAVVAGKILRWGKLAERRKSVGVLMYRQDITSGDFA